MSFPVTLLVLAKAPCPGRTKTRLCPPCTPEEAARLARAALEDTLDVVEATTARARTLVLDGVWDRLPRAGLGVIPQRGDGLDERLTAAFTDAGAPSLLLGMDTPQITPDLLHTAMSRLMEPDVDAVLGEARDGGYWAIGFKELHPRAFGGVPMSSPATACEQRKRLAQLNLRVSALPTLRDVDDFEDALSVAQVIPDSRFAGAVQAIAPGLLRDSA